MKYKVLIPQEVSKKGTDYLESHDCECVYLDDYSIENICRHVPDCDAILARTAEINREVMEAGKNLKIVARHGVGLDNVDLEAARELGIMVTTTPGANSNSVAEHTIALMLSCAKQIPFFDRNTRTCDWVTRDTKKTTDVSGKVLGLVGYGKISSLVAKKAALGLDMKVIVFRSHHEEKLPDYLTEAETMEDIFRQSDFVSFHAPLRKETEKIVNENMFALMKPSAFFINTARGASVDETALYQALKNKRIAGAALDVLAQEPPKPNHPLFALENLILSPHNAAHTIDSMDKMAYEAAGEIVRVLHGEKPFHCAL